MVLGMLVIGLVCAGISLSFIAVLVLTTPSVPVICMLLVAHPFVLAGWIVLGYKLLGFPPYIGKEPRTWVGENPYRD